MTMPTNLEMHRMLCLSTAHISHDTRDKLDAVCDFNAVNEASDLVIFEKYGFGWFLPVDVNLQAHDEGHLEHMPDDLVEALRFAYRQGADWLMLDCDGPVVNQLKDYR